jgi:hypothetical protein
MYMMSFNVDESKFAERVLDDRYECEKIDEIMEILKVILKVPLINMYTTRIFTFIPGC